MNGRSIQSDFWSICYKATLFFYVMILVYLSESIFTPWLILVALIYICVNITFYILQNDRVTIAIMALSAVLVIGSYFYIHPLLILLIPVNMYELITRLFKMNGVVFILVIFPAFFLTDGLWIQYGFIAIISFAYFTMLDTFSSKFSLYRDRIEEMQVERRQLMSRLEENNEYIRQSEYTYKLEARNRLSQEIHDQIGHSMTGALIQMEAAKRLLRSDPDKANELLQNAIHISKDGIESIRVVLKNMKPPTEQLGINRIKLFIDEFSATHSIKTLLTYDGDIDLIHPIHWKIIQENVKEALTNTMKYANATQITVDIQVLNTLIKTVVIDNGQGIQKIIKGLGIKGMEERAATVNGTVIVDGSRGFSVTTLIPYSG